MNTRDCRRLLAGLVLVALLGACSFSIKIPFVPDPDTAPDCAEECDESDEGGGSTALRFLRGR